MPTALQVFVVPAATKTNLRPSPVRLDQLSVDATGDAAKARAKASLTQLGYSVRSINWGPDLHGVHQLIAYVTKKG